MEQLTPEMVIPLATPGPTHPTPATNTPRTPSTPYSSMPIFQQPTQPVINPVADFKKTIKRSINDYQEFQHDNKWKKYKNHLLSVAATHDVSDVFVQYAGNTTNTLQY